MTFGEKIKALRLERGMTLEQVGDIVGVGKSTVRKWESGQIANMRRNKIALLARALGVTPGYLMGWETASKIHAETITELEKRLDAMRKQALPSNVQPISELHHQRVPLIGSVAAGQPIYDPEELGVYVEAPVDADAAITIHGDSMEPTYLEGDVVYLKCCPDVPEGAVAVVFLDDEATIKHIYKRPTGLTLWSDNPSHMPIQVEYEDYDNVRIFGVPVGFTRIYKPNAKGMIKKGF